MKGYIQVYTGNGKGKTTAAFGLALRATGAGKKVYIGQFVKGKEYYENRALQEYLPGINIEQYGRGCFIVSEPEEKDIAAARKGLKKAERIITQGEYDVIVLDEATIAIYYGMFTVNELLDIIRKKKTETEIIITGRYAPVELTDYADLVTEMKEVKHYFEKGVKARKGIEY